MEIYVVISKVTAYKPSEQVKIAMDYRDAFRDLGLSPDCCVYVASSALSIRWNPDFVADITHSLLEYFEAGTVVMPAFCSDFRTHGIFYVAESKSICGMVAEHFRQLPGVSRTIRSPIHTVCCMGKLSESILRLHAESSYGESSVFALLRKKDAALLLIDCPFFDGVPFINCLEEQYDVDYRYWKTISGDVIYENGARTSLSVNWFAKCIDQVPEGRIPFLEKARRARLTELGKQFYPTPLVKQAICGKTKFISFRVSDFYRFFEPLLQRDKNGFIQL